MTATDEFIQEKIPPQFHDIVAILRELIYVRQALEHDEEGQ